MFSIKTENSISNSAARDIVSKKKPLQIYNEIGEGGEDYYSVKWILETGSAGVRNSTMMKETPLEAVQKVSDQFVKVDSSEDSMENITKNIGIYFERAEDMFGSEGEIKVYDDETDDLIMIFNKDNWNLYSKNNYYKYEIPIKHIRIETSATYPDKYFAVYNIKELDDDYITTHYTLEEFNNLKYIKSVLVGYEENNTYINSDVSLAAYEEVMSKASISLNKSTISTQSTEKNMMITISASGNEADNNALWKDGIFLVKLPQDILDCEINNVTVTNSQVAIQSYEYYEENGERFIKIITSNDNPTTFDIMIDCNISPDPRIISMTEYFTLYAKNYTEIGDYYSSNGIDEYDLDGNSNSNEIVHKSTTSLRLVSQNSLLTNETTTDYDNNGSVTVAPNVAIIDKNTFDAKINIEIKNNYTREIEDIVVLGRVPHEGNEYVVSHIDMGSTFSASMLGSITVPEDLASYITIYYSENGEATQSIALPSNGWKTKNLVSDWTKVKSYLIVFNNYSMPTGVSKTFSYDIKIPQGLNYNDVTYSHHAVFFSLVTENGKYRTRTEPNKVGIMIAKEYELELEKYQIGKDKKISGATYSLTEDGKDESRTRVTNNSGVLSFKKLYLDRIYVLKEIKSPRDYELNDEEIKFRATENNNGEIEVTLISGNTKKIEAIQAVGNINAKIKIETEDEAKITLNIFKYIYGTEGAGIQGVKYRISGEKLGTNGKVITTNIGGDAPIRGLSLDTEYTLEEIKAEGYYINSQFVFKIVRESNEYKVKVKDENGSFYDLDEQGLYIVQEGGSYISKEIEGMNSVRIYEEDDLPFIEFLITNEPIPTYDLEITKIKHVTKVVGDNEQGTQNTNEEVTYLPGAKFKLYKGDKEIGEYITDANGKLTITGLYQYIEEKGIEQTYTLKETLAPEGYSKVKDIVFKVQPNTEDKLEFVETLEEGQTAKEYTSDDTKVNITVEDSPSFKLIKKDGETGVLLPNTKFAIYNVDDEEVPARNSKGEIIGTKETIDGKEYYTVATDANGEITLDLPEGMYKAVEVEALEKYKISNATYYFGIGVSREPEERYSITDAKNLSEPAYICDIDYTEDGDYFWVGCISQKAEQYSIGDFTLTNNGGTDALIVKFDSNDNVIWATSFGDENSQYINSVKATSDGGFIVYGLFKGSITIGEYTFTNNISYASYLSFLIKYNDNYEVEWATSFGAYNPYSQNGKVDETEDGKYIVCNKKYNSFTVGNVTIPGYEIIDSFILVFDNYGNAEWGITGAQLDENLNLDSLRIKAATDGGFFAYGRNRKDGKGFLIKYDNNYNIDFMKTFGEEIYDISINSNGDYLVTGCLYYSFTEGDYTFTSNGYQDGFVIKYDKNDNVIWADSFGGTSSDYSKSVSFTKDGGCIIGGSIGSYLFIRKYDKDNNIEWEKSDGTSNYNENIIKVFEIRDGSFMTLGSFTGDYIILDNYVIESGAPFYEKRVLVKYSPKEMPSTYFKNTKNITENCKAKLEEATATSDGGYIAGGYFEGNSITVGDYTFTRNDSSSSDTLLIKYDSNDQVEWATSFGGNSYDRIMSVCESDDGGFIVASETDSNIVNIGDYTFTPEYGDLYYGKWGIIVKYTKDGEVEWAKCINGNITNINEITKTEDGGFAVAGSLGIRNINTVTIDNQELYTPEYADENNIYYVNYLIKFDSNDKFEWSTTFGNDDEGNMIQSLSGTKDGGLVVGGTFRTETLSIGGYRVINYSTDDSYYYISRRENGFLAKYDKNGEAEWATSFGNNSDYGVADIRATSDGGFIVGTAITGSTSYERYLTFDGNSYPIDTTRNNDNLLVKYDSYLNIEWVKNIKGDIAEIIETQDGGYIVSFNKSEFIKKYTSSSIGMAGLVKFNDKNDIDWVAPIVLESGNISKLSPIELEDGRIMCMGNFSETVKFGEKTLTRNNSDYYNKFIIIFILVNTIIIIFSKLE